ncbi:hypothetical protein GE061_008218 [Apolygus lucorum]|uniref:Uncharacterized protein n=1 Tax=Apolygus lucorum TaxID=248454 RepID=A0A8S9WNB3_APOLU|nr:hypothetical protein GE061_008218 [Apolygus lucorum]
MSKTKDGPIRSPLPKDSEEKLCEGDRLQLWDRQKTDHRILLVSTRWSFVFKNYRKRLLELTKKLKGLNDESKRDLRAVTAGSVHSGSRGIIDNFEKVSSALEKVDSFVSTLQSGADALPIPALQRAAQYIPIVRHVLKAGRETIDTVVKAQKELANGGSLLSVKNLYGSLGVAKTLVSTVVGIFKKLKNPRNQSDNLNQFEAQRNEELSSPRQNFGSAAAQTDYGKIGKYLHSGLSFACYGSPTVFGFAVMPTGAVPASGFPYGVSLLPNQFRVQSPFGYRKSGARGIIEKDVSSLAMIPIKVVEWLINVPIHVLQTIAEISNKILRRFVSAEEVVNKFLKGDIFGPVGSAIEEVINDIYQLIESVYDWLFDNGDVNMNRAKVVGNLSNTMTHLMSTSRMLRQLF